MVTLSEYDQETQVKMFARMKDFWRQHLETKIEVAENALRTSTRLRDIFAASENLQEIADKQSELESYKGKLARIPDKYDLNAWRLADADLGLEIACRLTAVSEWDFGKCLWGIPIESISDWLRIFDEEWALEFQLGQIYSEKFDKPNGMYAKITDTSDAIRVTRIATKRDFNDKNAPLEDVLGLAIARAFITLYNIKIRTGSEGN